LAVTDATTDTDRLQYLLITSICWEEGSVKVVLLHTRSLDWMSPSNSSISLNVEPDASYHHMKQALFKLNKNGDENETVTEDMVGDNSNNPKVPSKSDLSEPNEECLNTKESISSLSNLPLITTISQQHTEECSNTKPSSIETNALNLSDLSPAISNPIAAAASVAAVVLTNNEQLSSTTTFDRNSPKNKGRKPLRRGKWTVEEEEYVARVIQDFNSGFLNAPAGYTLRSYLSDKLQCDPMRITKKFTGESCIGKRVFHPAVRSADNSTAIDKAQNELGLLENMWRQRLEMQQLESAKKAAASAAAATAASRGTVTVQGVPVAILGASIQSSSDSRLQQTAVTQAASWLDRANVILKGNIDNNETESGASIRKINSNDCPQQHNKDVSTHSSEEESLENQMKEVQRLIYEGPAIQQTTAGLPNLLLQETTAAAAVTIDQTQNSDNTLIAVSTTSNIETASTTSPSVHVTPVLEPDDKRLRTADSNTSGAEDAEALVGFLRSVRASAAAGQEL